MRAPFKTKQDLIDWHKREAEGWRRYASSPSTMMDPDKARSFAEMHESAVHVLETLE